MSMGKQTDSVVCLAPQGEELSTLQDRAEREKYMCNNVLIKYCRTLNATDVTNVVLSWEWWAGYVHYVIVWYSL